MPRWREEIIYQGDLKGPIVSGRRIAVGRPTSNKRELWCPSIDHIPVCWAKSCGVDNLIELLDKNTTAMPIRNTARTALEYHYLDLWRQSDICHWHLLFQCEWSAWQEELGFLVRNTWAGENLKKNKYIYIVPRSVVRFICRTSPPIR